MTHTLHVTEKMRWIAFAVVGIALAALILVQSRIAHGQNGQLNLDHFKCYSSQGKAVNEVVFLKDQFDQRDERFETVKVGKPNLFCNPAQKIHNNLTGSILNPENHLTSYRIQPVFDEVPQLRYVTVANQFGVQQLTVKEPRVLFVPTHKLSVDGQLEEYDGNSVQIDHFKCYKVLEGQPLKQRVILHDQFDIASDDPEASIVRIEKPELFCNPVSKIHHDFGHDNAVYINDPVAHLTCYGLKTKKRPPHQLVVENQFGPAQQLTAASSELLCVPSEKLEWHSQSEEGNG